RRRCACQGRRHRADPRPLEGARIHRQGFQGKRRCAWNATHEQNRRNPDQGSLRLVPERSDQESRENRRIPEACQLCLKEVIMTSKERIKKVSIIVSRGSLEVVYV